MSSIALFFRALPYIAAALFFYGVVEFGIHWERKDSQIAMDRLNAQIAAATKLASEQAQKAKAEQTARIEAVSTQQVEREAKTETITKVVNHEVIKYVQAPDIARVTLPAEWVRIHDRAASGTDLSSDAKATGQLDGAASSFTDADALSVVTDNYGLCHSYADRVTALQDYLRAL
jgi:hypothetical protein